MHLLVTLKCPKGADEEDVEDYVTSAVRAWCGSLEAGEDPMFELDRDSVTVSVYKGDKPPVHGKWVPCSIHPDEKFVLVCGYSTESKRWWRDVAVHMGDGRFVDKHGAGVTPLFWQPMPLPPEIDPEGRLAKFPALK